MQFIVRRVAVAVVFLLVVVGLFCAMPFVLRAIQDMRRGREFVPGLHEPRTGDTGDDIFAWVSSEAEILFEAYFDGRCAACVRYAEQMQEALEEINSGDLAGKVAFVAVNASQQTDKEVADFANKHKSTYPVLAGATEDEIARLPIEAVPTTFFWLKDGEKWGIVDRVEGAPGAEPIVEISRLFYETILHPQLHDVRTGEPGDSLADFFSPDAQIAFVVYVDTGCAACATQVQQLIAAREVTGVDPYGYTVDFLVVNGRAESAQALQEFIDAEGIPATITVLAGADEDSRGIPPDVTADEGVSMEIENLPALILFYEDVDGWRTWGFFQGEIMPAEDILGVFQYYADWRLRMGF
jgi:predicted DCC family thiol-disulfide oxidoreductase YuxK